MKITKTELADVLIVEPKVFADARGFFYESWNRRAFREATGLDLDFVGLAARARGAQVSSAVPIRFL